MDHVDPIHYTNMFELDFLDQMHHPWAYRNDQSQRQRNNFKADQNQLGAPPNREHVDLLSELLNTFIPEQTNRVPAVYKVNSALIAREENVDEIMEHFTTIPFYKAKDSEVPYYSSMPMRLGLDKGIRKKIENM